MLPLYHVIPGECVGFHVRCENAGASLATTPLIKVAIETDERNFHVVTFGRSHSGAGSEPWCRDAFVGAQADPSDTYEAVPEAFVPCAQNWSAIAMRHTWPRVRSQYIASHANNSRRTACATPLSIQQDRANVACKPYY